MVVSFMIKYGILIGLILLPFLYCIAKINLLTVGVGLFLLFCLACMKFYLYEFGKCQGSSYAPTPEEITESQSLAYFVKVVLFKS
jgi:hypothetical protein